MTADVDVISGGMSADLVVLIGWLPYIFIAVVVITVAAAVVSTRR
jgi:hypothetical protein